MLSCSGRATFSSAFDVSMVARARRKLSLQQTFLREFAGHPARVGLNMFATGAAGVLFGHYALGADISLELVFNAMLAPLGAMVIASVLKRA